MNVRPWMRRAGWTVLAVWIFGGALFYFVRFTYVFYRANQFAIDGVLDRICQPPGRTP